MTRILLPAIWLIVLIIGLPQLSETVYTPALPEIAHALRSSESMVEYTLAIYLAGFALGVLFFGKFSDIYGRKPSIIAGLGIFIIGCLGCYMATSIKILLIARFIQAFGGSIGSVLGQSICRDAFKGVELAKVYATTGSALACFPALGPPIGGFIAERLGWQNIFVFLTVFAFILLILVIIKLPETYHPGEFQDRDFLQLLRRLLQDKKVHGFGLLVAGANGIAFSYFAEGAFYLIKVLGLSPSKYGLSFIAISIATMLGGLLSRHLHKYYSSLKIIEYGLLIIAISTSSLTISVLIDHSLWVLPRQLLILITILSQMSTSFGICLVTSNSLALALVDYQQAIGTVSSLFGFYYYCWISTFTWGMGAIHDGTLLSMPLYFMGISFLMLLSKKFMLGS